MTINKETLRNFRLIVMSDSQGSGQSINTLVLDKLFKQIQELEVQPIYILINGDLVCGSKNPSILQNSFQQLKNFFTKYFPIEKLLPVMGNHDLGTHPKTNIRELIFSQSFYEFSADSFLKNYNRTVYYVDIGDNRLIVLNSYHLRESGTIANAQLDWLKTVVSDPMLNKLVFVHTPAFPTGSHTKHPLNLYPNERNKLWDIFDKNNVSIVFSGHEHNYSRRVIDNSFNTAAVNFTKKITQVIAGGAGGSLKNIFTDSKNVIVQPIAKHHFVIVDVDINVISAKVISEDGEILDQFTIETIPQN